MRNKKVCFVTVDNVSANNVALTYLIRWMRDIWNKNSIKYIGKNQLKYLNQSEPNRLVWRLHFWKTLKTKCQTESIEISLIRTLDWPKTAPNPINYTPPHCTAVTDPMMPANCFFLVLLITVRPNLNKNMFLNKN
jgi:hypothetical protein